MKSVFEQAGGTYTLQGDYRLPNLTLPAEGDALSGSTVNGGGPI